jgi:hypothetical protein
MYVERIIIPFVAVAYTEDQKDPTTVLRNRIQRSIKHTQNITPLHSSWKVSRGIHHSHTNLSPPASNNFPPQTHILFIP